MPNSTSRRPEPAQHDQNHWSEQRHRFIPKSSPPFSDEYGGQEIQAHGDEADESEPEIEGGGKKNDGDDDVHDGGDDVEEDVVEQRVHGIRASIHDAQDFARFARQMPAQRERMQMAEKVDGDLTSRVLLNADPKVT